MTAPEDGLDKRLTAALRELAQQAPSFNTDASALGRPRELPVDTRHHSWTRPLAAAAMVAAVGGVAVVTWQNFSETGDKVGVDHGSTSSSSQSPSARSRDGETEVSKFAVDRRAGEATAFELEPGYGRVSVDYAAGTVDVFWKGQPPVELQRQMERPGAVTVNFHDVEFSESDITAAARRLIQAKPSEVDGAKVVTVTPNADLSGAIVTVLRPWDGDQGVLHGLAGLPIEIVLTNEAVWPARG